MFYLSENKQAKWCKLIIDEVSVCKKKDYC